MPRADLCIVVPAYNEERVIEASVRSLCRVIRKQHVYVVSDGSADATASIAKRLVPNVLALRKNRGKAEALKLLIKKYKLTKRYKYILFADADSELIPDFLVQIRKMAVHNPACIVGRVMSHRHGLVSAYRTYEYGLTNRIFKRAQSHMHTITVAPGCASLYRNDVLEQLDFSERTITEDMDLTLQIHNKKLGDILYAHGAEVYTQDPPTIKAYWRQMLRWHTGFWQNVFLHKLYVPNSLVKAEIWLMSSDAFFWLAFIGFGMLQPKLFLITFVISDVIVSLLAAFLIALDRQWWALRYVPFFFLFQFVNIASYYYSFFRALRGRSRKVKWHKLERYVMTAGTGQQTRRKLTATGVTK